MNNSIKIGLILLILASVLFLCGAIAFFVMNETEKEKRSYLEKELETVIKAKDNLAKDLSSLKIQNRELESRLSSAKERAKAISEEVAREKEARRILAAQLEEEKKKAESLMADVMKEKEDRLNLVHQITKTEEEYQKLKEQFDLVVEAKETLEEKIKKMMAGKGVELERIEVGSGYYNERYPIGPSKETYADGSAQAPPAVIAQYNVTEEPNASIGSGVGVAAAQDLKIASVLVVNKKYNFIVANVGKVNGAKIGSKLDIFRNDDLIAKAQIEKLYDKMSASTILPKWRGARIKEGDIVYVSQ